jgi:hypothetical protein
MLRISKGAEAPLRQRDNGLVYFGGGGGAALPGPGAAGGGAPPPMMRASSCWLSSSVIWSSLLIVCFTIWCTIGLVAVAFGAGAGAAAFGAGAGAAAFGAGAGAAGAGFGGFAGVIGAFCANTGVASANTAAIATPFKSCFMFVVLCGSSGFVITRQQRAQLEGSPCGPSVRNNRFVVSFQRSRNSRIAYPTLPVPDNMLREIQVSTH